MPVSNLSLDGPQARGVDTPGGRGAARSRLELHGGVGAVRPHGTHAGSRRQQRRRRTVAVRRVLAHSRVLERCLEVST